MFNYENKDFDRNDLRFVSRPLNDSGFTLIEINCNDIYFSYFGFNRSSKCCWCF